MGFDIHAIQSDSLINVGGISTEFCQCISLSTAMSSLV